MSGPEDTGEVLSAGHAARARSAYDRAVAACRYAGFDQAAAEVVPTGPVARAANSLRLSAQSIDTLAASPPAPAAAARCARNAAAAAALAAQVAQSQADNEHGGEHGGELALEALRTALAASQAAALAAGGTAAGSDTHLNAAADDAERRAVAAAREAGWIRGGVRPTSPSAAPAP